MKPTKAQLILHPDRIRIIQLFASGAQLTSQQISSALSDIAPATLYRHISKLANAGILKVVEERAVRGALEKTYALPEGAANLSGQDVANVTPEEHMRYFVVFITSLLGDFARYLERDKIDLEGDGVGYRQVGLYLSDEEFQQMVKALNDVIKPLLTNQPRSDRRLHQFSTIIMPASDIPPMENSESS